MPAPRRNSPSVPPPSDDIQIDSASSEKSKDNPFKLPVYNFKEDILNPEKFYEGHFSAFDDKEKD